MPQDSIEALLRAQVEAYSAETYSARHIEERIALALVATGRFQENINAADLEIILRNVVYYMFAQQKVAGLDVEIVHNVTELNVNIQRSEASVLFEVHIHSPIIAFLKFAYTLQNDPDSNNQGLRLKPGSLSITQNTRRFDLKAKTALAAMNVPRIVQQELSSTRNIIRKTLPPQLHKQNIEGAFTDIMLYINSDTLSVTLEGTFAPLLADD